MKKIFLFLAFLAFTAGFAQDLGKGSGFSIPPAPRAGISVPATASPSPFEPSVRPSGTIGAKEPNSNFGKPSEFQNPGDRVVAKMNAVHGNVFLGDFKTSSSFIRIRYRDHEDVDGDLIQVFANGVPVGKVMLDGPFHNIEILLAPGTNKIDFLALNQGEAGANTAEFEVYDDQNRIIYSKSWYLETGSTASVHVYKQ
ncbi:MAG: hypothetical protein EOO51_05160 [Flavobacterium sp.]|nr:MAG: hypothetical protein EOO51_05160 [Flavobacterium sp.]